MFYFISLFRAIFNHLICMFENLAKEYLCLHKKRPLIISGLFYLDMIHALLKVELIVGRIFNTVLDFKFFRFTGLHIQFPFQFALLVVVHGIGCFKQVHFNIVINRYGVLVNNVNSDIFLFIVPDANFPAESFFNGGTKEFLAAHFFHAFAFNVYALVVAQRNFQRIVNRTHIQVRSAYIGAFIIQALLAPALN